jgi:hypothetical protein
LFVLKRKVYIYFATHQWIKTYYLRNSSLLNSSRGSQTGRTSVNRNFAVRFATKIISHINIFLSSHSFSSLMYGSPRATITMKIKEMYPFTVHFQPENEGVHRTVSLLGAQENLFSAHLSASGG